jgi:hydroxylamine dehydrogenase
MTLKAKKVLIIILSLFFLASLILVQKIELTRRDVEAGLAKESVIIPETSQACIACHSELTPGIVEHWESSTHAKTGVGCFECHEAQKGDADGFNHHGQYIATIVTPKDCSRCHITESEEFQKSHHANAGNILASLDNFLAETVEGARAPFNPHSPTPGKAVDEVNGMASAYSGCQQCHGSKVALKSIDGGVITVEDLKPDENGLPTNPDAVAKIARDPSGKPIVDASTWPNTGIGRLNLDGSKGSCSACHSRHDFSPRRARQPENCGKCHLGPDHPQKEIYEESKHGVAYRDLKDEMNLNGDSWILGKDYSQAPTCATCHMSGNTRNNGKITHDPGERISWTNRPPISLVMDTNAEGEIVTSMDPEVRSSEITDSALSKRNRMKEVCNHCHAPDHTDNFYEQYDDLVILFNEKFAKPGKAIMDAFDQQGLLSKTAFAEKIQWTWFYLWHHEGRRARHGASMMAPDYTHWHGMFEVSERFYMELIPEAREKTIHARSAGKIAQADAVDAVIDEILSRPEHKWFQEGATEQTDIIRKQMETRYGQ